MISDHLKFFITSMQALFTPPVLELSSYEKKRKRFLYEQPYKGRFPLRDKTCARHRGLKNWNALYHVETSKKNSRTIGIGLRFILIQEHVIPWYKKICLRHQKDADTLDAVTSFLYNFF